MEPAQSYTKLVIGSALHARSFISFRESTMQRTKANDERVSSSKLRFHDVFQTSRARASSAGVVHAEDAAQVLVEEQAVWVESVSYGTELAPVRVDAL